MKRGTILCPMIPCPPVMSSFFLFVLTLAIAPPSDLDHGDCVWGLKAGQRATLARSLVQPSIGPDAGAVQRQAFIDVARHRRPLRGVDDARHRAMLQARPALHESCQRYAAYLADRPMLSALEQAIDLVEPAP